MFKFETIEIDSKIYISNIETDEERISIPIMTSDGKNIYGIDSFAVIGQTMKEIIIPEEIKEIKENAFIDCFNLQTVESFMCLKDVLNLDKCFKKETENILFLVKNNTYYPYYKTSRYIVMNYFDIFKSTQTEFIETEDMIYLQSIPNAKELYIPDYYLGKEVSLSKMSATFFRQYTESPTKIRLPKNGFCKLSEMNNLKEICFSPETKLIHIPISNPTKIILYDKVENIISGNGNSYKDLRIFTLDETIKSLKNFNVPNLENSPWYKIITPNKGAVIYKGLLLNVPEYVKRGTFEIPKNVFFMRSHLFEGSNLSEIIFNDKIKNISRSCFENCYSLKKIYIPENISYIGPRAFAEDTDTEKKECCKDVTYAISKDNIEIEADAFECEEWLPFR